MATKRSIKKNVLPTTITMASTSTDSIVSNGQIRKLLIEGVLQDIKGYFENRTNGLIEVTYEDWQLKGHEFGFKLQAVRGNGCSKQMFSEASGAIVDSINYMLAGDADQYDVCIFTKKGQLEVEIVSNW